MSAVQTFLLFLSFPGIHVEQITWSLDIRTFDVKNIPGEKFVPYLCSLHLQARDSLLSILNLCFQSTWWHPVQQKRYAASLLQGFGRSGVNIPPGLTETSPLHVSFKAVLGSAGIGLVLTRSWGKDSQESCPKLASSTVCHAQYITQEAGWGGGTKALNGLRVRFWKVSSCTVHHGLYILL